HGEIEHGRTIGHHVTCDGSLERVRCLRGHGCCDACLAGGQRPIRRRWALLVPPAGDDVVRPPVVVSNHRWEMQRDPQDTNAGLHLGTSSRSTPLADRTVPDSTRGNAAMPQAQLPALAGTFDVPGAMALTRSRRGSVISGSMRMSTTTGPAAVHR